MLNKIESYDELIEYSFRKLGAPVVRINVTEEQALDRINDALQFYQIYHYNATEKVILLHQLSEQDIQNQFIILPDNMTGVQNVQLASNSMLSGWQGSNYSLLWTELRNALQSGGGMTSYIRVEAKLAEITSLFEQKHRWSFSKNNNRLSIQTNWSGVAVNSYALVEGWMSLNPEEFVGVFNDPWFKEYCTWMIKEQWGVNLTKFSNVTLPGGVEINGAEIASDARENISRMREEIEMKYQLPPMITLG